MKKNELTEAFRKASLDAGYAFHSGPAHRINGEVRVYPALWLEPTVLSSVEGRCEGDVKYRVTMHLMTLPTTAGHNDTLWTMLESNALAMVRSVASDNNVRDVSKISCIPDAQSITVHGEVSVTLVCDVTMWYYS